MVRVTPGCEPAKVSVVPNSPNERAKAKPAPVAKAGAMDGRVILPRTSHRPKPTPRAEARISWSSWRSAESTATTTKGSATKVCAITTPGKAKAKWMPRASRSGARYPLRPKAAVRAKPPTTGGMAKGR